MKTLNKVAIVLWAAVFIFSFILFVQYLKHQADTLSDPKGLPGYFFGGKKTIE